MDNKRCFKLICGAGNKDYEQITKLCALYSQAGCRFFDVNASVDAIQAAKKGIKQSKKDGFICVSVGTKNDPHISKFKIDTQKCILCGACEKVCPQNAISQGIIDENKCIGCSKCSLVCFQNATEKYSKDIPFSELLPPLIKEGIDCIEYHCNSNNTEEILEGWSVITNLFDGALSICLDRSKLGNEQIKELLLKMKESCDNLLMIQADGAPMSGGKDNFASTLQAVATADIMRKLNITPYLFMSGGTNSKTSELARQCGVDFCGIAIGSYARKIIEDYTDETKAIEAAKKLVESV